MFHQHGSMFAVVGVVGVAGSEPTVRLSEACLNGFEVEVVRSGEIAEILEERTGKKGFSGMPMPRVILKVELSYRSRRRAGGRMWFVGSEKAWGPSTLRRT